jgi:hypothetical protein
MAPTPMEKLVSNETGEGLNWMSQEQIFGENKPFKVVEITEEIHCYVGNDKTVSDVGFA